MRRKSSLVPFAATILASLSATLVLAQATQVVIDSQPTASPTPDTGPAGDGSDSAAATPLPPDADPNAPGLTPEQKSAAIKTHQAFVKAKFIAAKARVAAAKAAYAAAKEKTAQAKAAAAEGPSAAAQTSPASDSTTPASNGSSSVAPTPIPPDGDPNAPGLTPEQKRAASKAHRAHVEAQIAANKAQAEAIRQEAAAYREMLAADAEEKELEKDPDTPQKVEARQKAEERAAAFRAKVAADKAKFLAAKAKMRSPDEESALHDPTTFEPDHEKLNKFSYKAMFKMDAFDALNKALAIQGRTTKPNLTPSESALFQAIHSGQGKKFSFAEAALIASGVDDVKKRKEYMAKIDKLVTAAKAEADKNKSIVFKADAIMGYLIAVPMKNGYDDNTYSLAQVLDTGHFNCVSSCVTFVIFAHGAGLEVAAFVEPSHIVARVPGYDVQTTSGRIYPSEQRLKTIQDEKYTSEQMNKFDPDHPYHEVGDNGILLEIYQTIAGNARDKKQPDQAAIGALKEVFLDPTMPCAGHDVKVFMSDWFNNAGTTRKDVATAEAIAKLYRDMARDPAVADEMDQCVVALKKQLAKH